MRTGTLFLVFLAAGAAFSQGIITTVAGTGSAGFGGDGGPATSATLNFPGGVAADGNGNLFIADFNNQRIRKVNAAGIVTTVAGDGRRGYSGDRGPATAASLNLTPGFWGPYTGGLAADRAGNVYIADAFNHRVRKVDLDGNIRTIAGNGVAGFSGDGDQTSVASLSYPTGVALDAGGNLYISDAGNGRIRKIGADGTIITVAVGLSSESVTVDRAGNLYITKRNGVVKIAPDGTTREIGGVFGCPWGLAADAAANVLVADPHAQLLKRISPDGTTATIAGSAERIVEPILGESWVPCGSAGDGGPALNATLCAPLGVATDTAGTIYIADAGNNRIRKISAAGATPFIAAVTNAASFVRGLVPGGIVSIFGTNLSNVSGIVAADKTPLPTEISGTRVMVSGFADSGLTTSAAPLFAVANVNGQEQINLQIPWEVVGSGCYVSAPDGCDVTVVVINNGVSSNRVVLNAWADAQPGIFTVDGIYGAILHATTGQLVTASTPAARGEVVSIYATGMGPGFRPLPATGVPASADPLSIDLGTPPVTVGGLRAKVLFSGLAPGFVGLNQINVQIPTNVSSGSQDFIVSSGGWGSQSSQAVKVWIQ